MFHMIERLAIVFFFGPAIYWICTRLPITAVAACQDDSSSECIFLRQPVCAIEIKGGNCCAFSVGAVALHAKWAPLLDLPQAGKSPTNIMGGRFSCYLLAT